MLTGPANPSRSRADLPCSSSMEKLCARYSTSRQLRNARHSWRCVSAFAHDSAICHNGHRWKARRVRGACTRLESTGRDQRSHLAELVPLAHVEHPRGKCSAADGPQASERLRKSADAYRHFASAIPECRVPPFCDRSLDHETPVLIEGYRQDAAMLGSQNVLDPPRCRP